MMANVAAVPAMASAVSNVTIEKIILVFITDTVCFTHQCTEHINISVYLEKIKNNINNGAFPGLVDLFVGDASKSYLPGPAKHIKAVYGTEMIDQLEKSNILLARRFKHTGIDVYELLLKSPLEFADTVFELDWQSYASYPTSVKKRLAHYNVVVHDFMEGGFCLQNIDVLPGIKSLTGSADQLPVYMLSTLAESIRTNNLCKHFPEYTDKKLAIVPIHKPRTFRLDLLEALDQAGLLDYCDWSLWFNTGDVGEIGNFSQSPNVSARRWSEQIHHPFVQKHWHLLPKPLDYIESIEECVPLHKQYHGKYKWHIVCETYMNLFFATEKTFKAFVAGHIPLTVAPAGFNSLLEKIGFVMPGDYDSLSGQHRISKIIETLKNDHTDYTEVAKHNYHLATSVEKTSSIIVDRLSRLTHS